jgi:quinol monooxygenase YgiN
VNATDPELDRAASRPHRDAGFKTGHDRTDPETAREQARANSPAGEPVLGHRALYIYWKTHDLPRAMRAAARLQTELCQRIEGLQAELLQRDSGADDRHTLMEIYRHPQGIDAPLQRLIVQAAGPALATVLASPRVVEPFRPVVFSV